MSNVLKYRVFPHDPHEASPETVTLSPRERNNIEGLGSGVGCFLWVGIFVVLYALYALYSVNISSSSGSGSRLLGPVLAIAGASIAVALMSSLVKENKVSNMKRKKLTRNGKELTKQTDVK